MYSLTISSPQPTTHQTHLLLSPNSNWYLTFHILVPKIQFHKFDCFHLRNIDQFRAQSCLFDPNQLRKWITEGVHLPICFKTTRLSYSCRIHTTVGCIGFPCFWRYGCFQHQRHYLSFRYLCPRFVLVAFKEDGLLHFDHHFLHHFAYHYQFANLLFQMMISLVTFLQYLIS